MFEDHELRAAVEAAKEFLQAVDVVTESYGTEDHIGLMMMILDSAPIELGGPAISHNFQRIVPQFG